MRTVAELWEYSSQPPSTRWPELFLILRQTDGQAPPPTDEPIPAERSLEDLLTDVHRYLRTPAGKKERADLIALSRDHRRHVVAEDAADRASKERKRRRQLHSEEWVAYWTRYRAPEEYYRPSR